MVLAENQVELSIIMPVFNEENIISDSIRETLEILDSSKIFFELIVVDDGSSDRTIELIEGFKDRIIFLSYGKNIGKGYAMRYGASRAKGKIIAFYDSDLNISPDHLVDYFSYLKVSDADIIIGSKRLKNSVIRTTIVRRILSTVYHLFAKAMFGLFVMDTQVGIKLFRRKVLDEILPMTTIDGFAIDVELLILASILKYRIVEAPVSINMNFSDSHISLGSVMDMFLDTLKIAYKLKIARNSNFKYKIPYNSLERESR